jgi:hypothetical protein
MVAVACLLGVSGAAADPADAGGEPDAGDAGPLPQAAADAGAPSSHCCGERLGQAADAGRPPATRTPRIWPDGKIGRPHLMAGAAFGACIRDGEVAGGGSCGELSIGTDVPLPARFRFGAELGVGFMSSVTSGDPMFGVSKSSGGPAYGALRVMLGYDFTDLFFVRSGPQTRATFAFGKMTTGVQLAVDLGTRVSTFRLHNRLEVGLRSYLGFDGVAATATPKWSTDFCFGTTVLLRYRIQ